MTQSLFFLHRKDSKSYLYLKKWLKVVSSIFSAHVGERFQSRISTLYFSTFAGKGLKVVSPHSTFLLMRRKVSNSYLQTIYFSTRVKVSKSYLHTLLFCLCGERTQSRIFALYFFTRLEKVSKSYLRTLYFSARVRERSQSCISTLYFYALYFSARTEKGLKVESSYFIFLQLHFCHYNPCWRKVSKSYFHIYICAIYTLVISTHVEKRLKVESSHFTFMHVSKVHNPLVSVKESRLWLTLQKWKMIFFISKEISVYVFIYLLFQELEKFNFQTI